MELLRGTAPKVKFYGPTPNTEISTATYSVNGVVPIEGSFEPVEGEGAWELQLPYIGSDTNNVEVRWVFTIPDVDGEFDEVFPYEAVTPLLSKQELLRVFGEMAASDEEMWEVEAAVRHVINAHTGQKFGLDKDKALTVEGNGETSLRLPERLIKVSGVNTLTSMLSVSAFHIVSDGWYIKKSWADATPLANPTGTQFWGDINGNAGPFDNTIYHDPDDGFNPPDSTTGLVPVSSRPGGITVAPNHSGNATGWKRNYPFIIRGDWGYETVPAAVKEAARLLVNDYACSEALYRDRYLESIKAADWRLQFSSRAWDSTGNARVDHLLSEFVLTDMAVI